MKMQAVIAGAVALSATAAMANQTLQFDLNAAAIQVRDGAGDPAMFGGLTHTGSIDFEFAGSASLDMAVQVGNGPFVDAGFTGSVTDLSGSIELDSGAVKGGSLTITIDSGDVYTTSVVDGSGSVKEALTPGGFAIDGLTFKGSFTDAMWGNIDVTDWFDNQDKGQNLAGSLLEFNFDPNDTGAGFADVDHFVVVPLPAPALAGGAMLAGLAGLGVIRRRK